MKTIPRLHMSPAIIHPVWDAILLYLCPIVVLIAAIPLLKVDFMHIPLDGGKRVYEVVLSTIIMSHLVIVFFRSHNNTSIFKLYPIRFTIIPIALFLSIVFSVWAVVLISILATWWDVYHSSLQTFGIGRIYDMKSGNQPAMGRRLDYGLNLLLYVGPILAGATLMDHAEDFIEFNEVGFKPLASLPGVIFSHRSDLQSVVFFIGAPLIVFYLFQYYRYFRQGYQFSVQKVLLIASTAFVSVTCWGFNRFAEAFFVMNVFHAIQYFAIVWHFEKDRMASLFRFSHLAFGRLLTFSVFIALALGYGFFIQDVSPSSITVAISLSVSILHFWYDGFIWSVRKKQIA